MAWDIAAGLAWDTITPYSIWTYENQALHCELDEHYYWWTVGFEQSVICNQQFTCFTQTFILANILKAEHAFPDHNIKIEL